MAWSKRAQVLKKLRRHGVVGSVAALYAAAGFSVTIGFKTPKGEVGFLARKGGEVYAVDVHYGSRPLSPEQVEAIASKAGSISARPILVVYGRAKVSDEAWAKARELGVKVKHVRRLFYGPH